MVKRTTTISITLILLLVVLIGGGLFIQQSGIGDVQRGFTINSISAPQIFDNQDLSEKNFIVDVTFDAGADEIIGEISPSDFESFSGVETNLALKIEATAINEILDYDIINDKEPVYDYSTSFLEDPSGFGGTPDCPSSAIADSFLKKSLANDLGRHCFFRDQVGVKGSLSNPSVENKVGIRITVGSESIEREISNKQTQANFGSRASVIATGILSTGDPAPNPNRFVAIFNINNQRWGLASSDAWINYISRSSEKLSEVQDYPDKACLDLGFTACTSLFGTSDEDVIEASKKEVDELTDFPEASNLIASDEKLITNQEYVSRSSEDNSVVRIKLLRRTGNLRARFLIQASWIGVNIKSGEPSISSSGCGDNQGSICKSGEECFITGTVKNTGSGEGTFEASVSGCSPFRQLTSGFNTRVKVNPGSTASYSVELSDGGAIEAKEICTITLTDLGSGKSDSSSISCELEAPELCNSGQEGLIDNCVFTCKEDGSGIEEKPSFCCDTIPRSIAGTSPVEYECRDDELEICDDGLDNDGDGDIDEKDSECTVECGTFDFQCKLDESGKFEQAKIIISILAGLLVLLSIFSFASKRTNNNILSWTFAIIFGIAIGYLTFLLFIFGIIIAVFLIAAALMFPAPARAIKKRAKLLGR